MVHGTHFEGHPGPRIPLSRCSTPTMMLCVQVCLHEYSWIVCGSWELWWWWKEEKRTKEKDSGLRLGKDNRLFPYVCQSFDTIGRRMMNFGWRSSYELSTLLGESTFPAEALYTAYIACYCLCFPYFLSDQNCISCVVSFCVLYGLGGFLVLKVLSSLALCSRKS